MINRHKRILSKRKAEKRYYKRIHKYARLYKKEHKIK